MLGGAFGMEHTNETRENSLKLLKQSWRDMMWPGLG